MNRYLALVFENERPLLGLAGWLDWMTHGELHRFAKAGFLTGAKGEICVLPYRRRTFSVEILLVGMGMNVAPGERTPSESLQIPKHNPLPSLEWNQVCVSSAEYDFFASWKSKGEVEWQKIDV